MFAKDSVSGGTSESAENLALVTAHRGSVGRLRVSCLEVAIDAQRQAPEAFAKRISKLNERLDW